GLPKRTKPTKQLPKHPPRKTMITSGLALAQRIRQARTVVVDSPLPTPAATEFLGKSIIDLERDECRYPEGDGPILFCGQRVVQGSPYCPQHTKLCYIGRK